MRSRGVRGRQNAGRGMIRTDVRVEQNADTTRVHILELGQVIDLAVNNDPLPSRYE